jgi:hypothetical protein
MLRTRLKAKKPNRFGIETALNESCHPAFSGSPQEFVKPLFSLSFRDWGCWRPIRLGGIGSESPPMFTAISALSETHRRRQPESGPFPLVLGLSAANR